MLSAVCLALPTVVFGDGAGPPGAGPAAGGAPPAASAQPAPSLHPARARLEGKLRVEGVLLKGRGTRGTEIEVSYRIVDVSGYAAHPKTSFVTNEASGRLVALRQLQKLFAPLPAEQAEAVPPARLVFWDKAGIVKPGQPVTVVVAGYGQRHLLPEAGPGYDREAVAAAPTPEASPLAAPNASLTVHEAKVVGGGHLLNVRFSSDGIRSLDPNADQTYVENPATGERHPVVRVPRIGLLAPKDLEKLRGSYMVIDNGGHRIKGGQRVHVAVSGVRHENVPVAEE